MRTKRFCIIDGCDGPHVGLGYCEMHYKRHIRGVPMDQPIRKRHDEAELVTAIRAALPGRTRIEAAKIVGCHPSHLDRIRRKHGIPPGYFWRAPQIPPWVPPSLIDGYAKRMRRRGQIDAAAWARAEKARLSL